MGGGKVDTLMRYLINSLQADENDYGDQLNPLKNEVGKSLMGEHRVMEPATTGDVRTMGEVILNRLDAVTMAAHTDISGISRVPVPTPTHVIQLPVTSLIPSPTSCTATAAAQRAQNGSAPPQRHTVTHGFWSRKRFKDPIFHIC